MVMVNQPTTPPGESAKGVGRGQCARVLFNLADRLRKKLITKLNEFILVFYIPRFVALQKMMHNTPSNSSLCFHLLSLLPSIDAASFWLVVVCVLLDGRPCKADVLLIFV